jgi:hypothetical protein
MGNNAAGYAVDLGRGNRPGCRSARLAPHFCGVGSSQTLVNFERSCEPRGRVSLRPGRARSPIRYTSVFFCS